MRAASVRIFALVLAPLLSALGASGLAGQKPESQRALVDFARDIEPIFRVRCLGCHGPTRQESNFRLDVRAIALGTADFGDPPIRPNDADASPLIQFVSGKSEPVMPPEDAGEKLDPVQVQLLRRWIDQGANWPDELAGEDNLELKSDHWSYQPLGNFDPPSIESHEPPDHFPIRNGIDRFIWQRLADRGLSPAPPANRQTLIRRMYLDLHGLLPTPEKVQAYVDDPASNVTDQLIEDLLESPHYGERWARHWLDVVRFGESTGYEVNRDRANSWYYRDYVIQALNRDTPYRDFIIEQLAGDALGKDAATGFLVGGPYDIVKSPDINLTLMQRQDELADYVHTTTATFLGLTVACARCHNHKFDPILQRDYYQLQACFAGVEHGERPVHNQLSDEQKQKLKQLQDRLADLLREFDQLRQSAPVPPDGERALPMVTSTRNTDLFEPINAKFLRFIIARTNNLEPCIDELEIYHSDQPGENLALASNGTQVRSSGDYQGNPKHKLAHLNDGRVGNDFSWISDTSGSGWVEVQLPQETLIDHVIWARDRSGNYRDRLPIVYRIEVSLDAQEWTVVADSNRRKPFLVDGREPEDLFIARLKGDSADRAEELWQHIKALRQERQTVSKLPMGYLGKFKTPDPTFRLYRGDPQAPREEVAPDVLTLLGSLNLDKSAGEQERRMALARWIADDSNPLTARVIVNRVWQYHFGQGIVATPSDLGQNGMPPSHPELLDWLATQFMANGWSLKWLHRQILDSSTYQQSSQPRTQAIAVDADSKYLWRFPPRRLEAEAIRDCILQTTGKLNPQAGGPGFLLFRIDRENVHHYFPLDSFGPEHFRRMIYMTKIRQEQDDVFGSFDCPDGGQTIPRRSRSTTALQALNLLNSPFMMEQVQFLADRLESTVGDDPAGQVRQAYLWAYCRPPTTAETQDAVQFIRQHGLSSFCRALLNSNEFLFLS